MIINGQDIPLSLNNYIWMIRKVHHINIVKRQFINDCTSPYDILGYILVNQYEEDVAYGRYIKNYNIINHGKNVRGQLNIQECINNCSYVNGKFINDIYYNQTIQEYNMEILSLIKYAFNTLVKNKELFQDSSIFKRVKRTNLKINVSNIKYRDANFLKRKYKGTPLEKIISVCILIKESTLRRVEKDSNIDYIDNSVLISVRHLVENIIREEIKRYMSNKYIDVFNDSFSPTETVGGDKTDITVLCDNCIIIIDMKTGTVTDLKRKEFVGQVSRYMIVSSKRYGKEKQCIGMVLTMEGNQRDSLRIGKIYELNSMQDVLDLDTNGDCPILSMNFKDDNTEILENQIKHLVKLIVEYVNA